MGYKQYDSGLSIQYKQYYSGLSSGWVAILHGFYVGQEVESEKVKYLLCVKGEDDDPRVDESRCFIKKDLFNTLMIQRPF